MLFYTGVKDPTGVPPAVDADRHKRQLRVMRDLVDEAVTLLNSSKDLGPFGELLHESWQLQAACGETPNESIEAAYDRARAAGALGGKPLGTAGGFLLLFVPPEAQPRVRLAMDELVHVPFEFEFSGSQIIFFDPEKDYSRAEEDRAIRTIGAFREADRPVATSRESR
jgi:D-glycero-alpha-D-manno-heptose-7-phosphate kinase